MIEKVFKCDGCGVVRGEANHWWIATSAIPLDYSERKEEGKNLTIRPWDDVRAVNLSQGQKIMHLCSRTCVAKVLNSWMDSQGVHTNAHTANRYT